jgi:serine/threonine protein phosphatase 1
MNGGIIPQNNGRLIAVGDIHGCSQNLRVILKGIVPEKDDAFVFLGDFVDRGPDSKGVIDEILALSEICTVHTICGNHEEMILAAIAGGSSDFNFWCKFGGIETLASYGAKTVREIPYSHLRFIADCKDYLENDEYIFVHAGCNPNIPLHENNGDHLRWNRPVMAPHISGKTVVCGHTVQRKILDLGHYLCIDTACGVWPGGRLTAIDLKSGKIWQAGARTKKAIVKQR